MSEAEFTALVKAFGAERVLFGTDSPWTHSQTEIQRILRVRELDEEEIMAILGENACRLLNLGF